MAVEVKVIASGNIRDILEREPRERVAEAVSRAVRAATRGLQLDLRDHVKAAFPAMERYSGAIRSQVYPAEGRPSLKTAGIVYPRGEQAQRIFSAHVTGALILPGGARALAIPLHNFRTKKGKRGPREFGQKLAFIPFKRSANLIGVLATAAPQKKRGGLTAAGRKAIDTQGRRGLAAAIGARFQDVNGRSQPITARYVPQFLLVRRAKLTASLQPFGIAQKWAAQMPGLVAYALRGVR